jgi:hypothetical protein
MISYQLLWTEFRGYVAVVGADETSLPVAAEYFGEI